MAAPGATVRVDADWRGLGLTAVLLANAAVEVVVLPELGGRVWELTHRASGRQLLWHHPLLRPAPVPPGSAYDDNFIGGWDELFPNDVPETLGGAAFPDHGEAWSAPWAWEVLPGPDAAVRLQLDAPLSGSTLQRTLRLAPGAAAVDLDVEVTNGAGRDLPMLHKQHLAVDLPVGSRIDLPPSRVEIGGFGTPRAGTYGDRFAWPHLTTADGVADFAASPPDGTAELLFAGDLAAGWAACTGPDGVGVGVVFDTGVYPACWTFASWNGWQDLRVAVLEPCTGVGLSVADGVAAGTHRVLAAGETLRTTLTVVAFDGFRQVTGISGSGAGCRVEGVQR